MASKRNSVTCVIDDLARLTEASPGYVDKIRLLLERRGVSMDDDAGPYLDVLEDVFIRQQAIRENVAEARDNLARLQSQLTSLGRRCDEPLDRIDRVQQSLLQQLETMRDAGRRLREVLDPAGRREEPPGAGLLVPGPDGAQ